MAIRRSKGKLFYVCNYIFCRYSLTCLFPIIHVLSISLSSVNMVDAGKVRLFDRVQPMHTACNGETAVPEIICCFRSKSGNGVLVNMLITSPRTRSQRVPKSRKRTYMFGYLL